MNASAIRPKRLVSHPMLVVPHLVEALLAHPLRTPRWEYAHGELLAKGRKIPWEQKIDRAVFTGNMMGTLRQEMYALAEANPSVMFVNEVFIKAKSYASCFEMGFKEATQGGVLSRHHVLYWVRALYPPRPYHTCRAPLHPSAPVGCLSSQARRRLRMRGTRTPSLTADPVGAVIGGSQSGWLMQRRPYA